MNGSYLQCERARGSWKYELKVNVKVNVLYIIDQDHQGWAAIEDHSS